MKYGISKNYGNGQWLESKGELIDVYSPVNGELIAQTYNSKKEELDEIVEAATIAQQAWGALTLKKRSEVLYSYRNLLLKHREELAVINHEENGKSMGEAYAGIDKAIELTEFACSIPQLAAGEIEEVSRGVVCRTERRPLGVVASITPFNFPVMVPHWTVPNAIAMGNAIIVKPSELTPLSAAMMAKLWKEAGLPDGIFNIFNGGKDAVEAISDHPQIQAVSFVGSTPVAQIVYKRATSNLKRSLALGGAKNYLVVAPDAHPVSAPSDIVASATGMSGQRCMAASVMVMLGDSEHILDSVVEKITAQKAGVDIPPIVSMESIAKIENYIENAEKLGAKILVDGRTQKHGPGYNFGGTVIDWRGLQDKMPLEEVFGPVLEVVEADNLKEALEIQQASPYGNAGSVFTQNGRVSDEALRGLQAGMLGVNIGVPVPREPFSFGGIKGSKYGFGDITGKLSLDFWSHLTKITTKWNTEEKADWMS
ncbi:aldehyde dehydrogenase family protein [Erysipelothrix urinaevulpis]|uniref:aldehyde dehydrogenase family protein n=1 Tax=Erysipelothrix urinaevulpis TaxID=2683717 RepID=UPI00135AA860|nr:aldehyde dehydrogenase family protein [Erysipelothrix urinaevulpis]